MRIGVISEGHSDRAVITNIVAGVTGLDASDIEPLRPIYTKDETDKALVDPRTFSSWSIVKEECQSRELIDGFLAIDGQDYVIIHMDTAEAELYGITRPNRKSKTYCSDLLELVIQKIISWLNEDPEQIIYAIAIEEIDAWIFTIFDVKDSAKLSNPKKALAHILQKKGINSSPGYENYLSLSDPFSSKKKISKGDFLSRNCSLDHFVKELEVKILSNLPPPVDPVL